MTTKQQNKLAMYLATKSVLDANNSVDRACGRAKHPAKPICRHARRVAAGMGRAGLLEDELCPDGIEANETKL